MSSVCHLYDTYKYKQLKTLQRNTYSITLKSHKILHYFLLLILGNLEYNKEIMLYFKGS